MSTLFLSKLLNEESLYIDISKELLSMAGYRQQSGVACLVAFLL